ncbi:MAG: YraN family protein [Phycisphaerales bacterium JB041]
MSARRAPGTASSNAPDTQPPAGRRGLLARIPLVGHRRARAAHLDVGARGERAASRFLRGIGCRTLARNLQTPGGEADLVCLERRSGTVVLVEVKSRVRSGAEDERASRSISPAEAINADKRRRLVNTARSLRQHSRFRNRPIRIDVVTVEYAHPGDRSPAIRHYVNAVTASGRLR